MTYAANSPDEYIASLPADRQAPLGKLREAILANLPAEFEEIISYGHIGYVVPHAVYPAGYHCDPKLPLPFLGIASQKNFVSVGHMGIYADPALLEWFTTAYGKLALGKLDMGKSCIRFKKMDKIPYALIGELASKMTASDWIEVYEREMKR